MNKINKMEIEFKENGGVLKTSELNELGFSSRQIKRLLEDKIISRIKYGFYELIEYSPREEVVISKVFPEAVIFLESALMHYRYTDRIPSAWQIAVNRYNKTTKYDIESGRLLRRRRFIPLRTQRATFTALRSSNLKY